MDIHKVLLRERPKGSLKESKKVLSKVMTLVTQKEKLTVTKKV